MKDKNRNQIVYLLAVDVLRRWGNAGQVTWEILERINLKNAEKMECLPIALH